MLMQSIARILVKYGGNAAGFGVGGRLRPCYLGPVEQA